MVIFLEVMVRVVVWKVMFKSVAVIMVTDGCNGVVGEDSGGVEGCHIGVLVMVVVAGKAAAAQ